MTFASPEGVVIAGFFRFMAAVATVLAVAAPAKPQGLLVRERNFIAMQVFPIALVGRWTPVEVDFLVAGLAGEGSTVSLMAGIACVFVRMDGGRDMVFLFHYRMALLASDFPLRSSAMVGVCEDSFLVQGVARPGVFRLLGLQSYQHGIGFGIFLFFDLQNMADKARREGRHGVAILLGIVFMAVDAFHRLRAGQMGRMRKRMRDALFKAFP